MTDSEASELFKCMSGGGSPYIGHTLLVKPTVVKEVLISSKTYNLCLYLYYIHQTNVGPCVAIKVSVFQAWSRSVLLASPTAIGSIGFNEICYLRGTFNFIYFPKIFSSVK